ncbi:MAG TPA: hypothetical protein VEP66_05585 [Myxococcales bacterium]|nr:hypothetical protein [Myxococcales bacterium]
MATTSKPYDKALPFTRINSPSENLAPTRLSGDGHTRGTRREGDFLEQALIDKIVRKLILLTPSWTTTRGTTERDVEQEIQGKLVRSFQTWTDAPPFQWHRWYDWNFHLEPDPGYDWLRGLANETTGSGELPVITKGDVKGRNQHVVFGSVMECEWDTGSFAPDTMQRPGPMFDADWAWPMANQRVWLVGRSIYDGGHETSHGLCRSELHPCKAVASARWEAFNFKENNGGQAGGRVFTPAIQFMFFSSRFGGFVDYPDLRPADGQPYQFIVDLPEAPAGSTGRMAVGGTPDTAMNTVVLRSNQLLINFDRPRFANTRGGRAPNVDPIVELLPEDPAHPRLRQAKVTIPLSALTGDSYGVLISLGWRDVSGEQAARVKKCTVKLKNLFKAGIDHDTFSEEWRLKAGVNGRWFQWEFNGVRNNTNHSLERDEKNRPTALVIHLHEDDALQLAAHGAELDLVDDVYMGSNADRTISVSNADVNVELGRHDRPLPHNTTRRPVDWKTQIDVRPPATGSPGSYPVQRAIARRIFSLMWTTFNDQNDPLGLIDGISTAPRREQPHNPLKIGPEVGRGERSFSITGYETWEEGTSAELLERPHFADAEATRSRWIDYRIDYTVKVENQ